MTERNLRPGMTLQEQPPSHIDTHGISYSRVCFEENESALGLPVHLVAFRVSTGYRNSLNVTHSVLIFIPSQ